MNRIRNRRKKRGMSQAQLADVLQVNQTAVSHWERGGMPRAQRLPALAAALGCTVDGLLADGKDCAAPGRDDV